MLACAALGCGPSGPPNLVLITVDTLRADRLACWGGAPDVGTNLCALADAGVRYEWAFSTASQTIPSIASILTSSEPHVHGMTQRRSQPLDPGLPTLAAELAAAGWTTGAFVGNPILRRASRGAKQPGSGIDRGFAHYDDEMKRAEAVRVWVREREAAELTDAALAWIATAEAPWLLWVHYQDPHGPYWPPRMDAPRDEPGAEPLPVLPDESGWKGIPSYQVIGDARALATYERRYADEIRYFDGHLARLVAGVDALGPAAIALTSDHGEAFGEDDYYFAHGHSVGVDQIRVPLVLRAPGAARGEAVAAPVSTLDVMPTLLALAGVPIPSGVAGRVLPKSSASAPPPDPERFFFAEHRLRLAAIGEGLYYARDREGFDAPLPDRITGGQIPPLPARSAALAPGGAFRGYEASDGGPPASAEQRVAELLALLRGGDEGEERDSEVDEASRKMLRALGYVE